jgi:hypothetical protein
MKITVLGAVLIALAIISAILIIQQLNEKKSGKPGTSNSEGGPHSFR